MEKFRVGIIVTGIGLVALVVVIAVQVMAK